MISSIAMEDELKTTQYNKVWELVDLPEYLINWLIFETHKDTKDIMDACKVDLSLKDSHSENVLIISKRFYMFLKSILFESLWL